MRRSRIPAARLALCAAALWSAAPVHGQCEQRLTPADGGPGDLLGRSLAASGDVLAVGGFPLLTEEATGVAYVYRRTPDGWVEEQELVGSDVGLGDAYGFVAVDGGTVVVGAPAHDEGRGAVYVFDRSGAVWTETQELSYAGLDRDDYFGNGLAISGDSLLVGAHGRGVQSGTGAAFVYGRDAGVWSLRQELVASDHHGGDQFGVRIAIAAGSVLIAATDADVGEHTRAGAVYVFEVVGRSWVEAQKLTSSAPAFGQQLGQRLAASGARFVAATLGQGAYVFEHDGTRWVESAHLSPQDGGPLDGYAMGVGLDGDLAAVGSPFHGDGVVYPYAWEEGAWREGAPIAAGLAQPEARHGWNVLAHGRELLAAAPWQDGTAVDAGAVLVHDLDCLAGFAAYGYCDTDAPCENPDPAAGCANSGGAGALLEAAPESTNEVSADDLRLVVSNVPPRAYGLVYMGPNRERVPFGDGLRTVEPGPPGRYYRFPVRRAGAQGAYAEGPGLVAWSHATFDAQGAITAGSTWSFQGFYRDPAGPCGSGFNLTNGLAVGFVP